MHFLRVISLAFLAGVLAHSIPAITESHETPELQQQGPILTLSDPQDGNPGAVLDVLLARIKIETAIISMNTPAPPSPTIPYSNYPHADPVPADATLARYPDPLSALQQKLVTAVVGLAFNRITQLVQDADDILKSTRDDDKAGTVTTTPQGEDVDEEFEDGRPVGGNEDGKCGKMCMSKKTNNIVKEVGHAALNAVLKVGLGLLGKHIHPAFLALSGFVLTVNTIVGGALVVLSALVNGVFLAIAGGIAYLGHLASDKERQRMGGPGGPKTKEIAQVLGMLGRAVG